MIKYPRRALDKGSNAAGARSAGKAEAAGRRLVLITVCGQAREFGSRLPAACIDNSSRASPRMRIGKCARSSALAEILDPGRREGRMSEGIPARAQSEGRLPTVEEARTSKMGRPRKY